MYDTIQKVKQLDLDPDVRSELVAELQGHDDEMSTLQSKVDELQNQVDDWEQGFTGKEAEELRRGIEKVVGLLDTPVDLDIVVDTVNEQLTRLLDKVDARDSLRYLEESLEHMAALYHAQWSGWVNYLFEKASINEDGSVTLPREFVTQWSRQATLLWPEMTGKEQKNAREAASKLLQVLEVIRG